MLLIIALFINQNTSNKESGQLRISDQLDTVMIRNEPEHGFYLLKDSLSIYSGSLLMDQSLCDQLPHRSKPIWTWKKNSTYQCRLSDIEPPFYLWKAQNSDTLNVSKNNQIFLFRLKDS
mgnify:CR=1 FL=1